MMTAKHSRRAGYRFSMAMSPGLGITADELCNILDAVYCCIRSGDMQNLCFFKVEPHTQVGSMLIKKEPLANCSN
jgi:hypothetical protein